MKRLQNCLSSVIVLAVLFCVSACKRNDADTAQLKEAAQRGEQSYRQYRSADYAAGKAALLDYIRYLEGKLADPAFSNGEAAKSDIMLSYARLAKLEEMNNGPEKDSFTQRAVAACQTLKRKRDCSPEDLRGQVDGLDALLPAK